MSRKVTSYITDASRNLKSTDFALRVYGIWALATLVIFGYFGIRPLIKTLRAKSALITELKSTNQTLGANIKQMKTIEDNLSTYKTAIEQLDKYMPAGFDSHNFLIDLMSAAASSGYLVQRFNPETVGGANGNVNELLIQTKLDGTGDLRDLITKIEDMKRITQIKDLRYTFDEDVSRGQKEVMLQVIIYSTQ